METISDVIEYLFQQGIPHNIAATMVRIAGQHTLRDDIAITALNALILDTRPVHIDQPYSGDLLAKHAYAYADAMLRARATNIVAKDAVDK